MEGGGTHIPGAGVLAGVRLSESGLAFSSQALLQLFENIPVAICITTGTDHRFVYANSHYRRALVPDSGDPAGRRLKDLFGAALRPQTYAIRDRVLADSCVASVSESPVRDTSSGSAMYWDITYFPVADGIAAKRGILTFAIDVTERVAARREAEERAAAERARAEEATYDRERLALAVEATGLGIWEWNVETGETRWSDRQKEIWGLSHEDAATYVHWRASIHPEDRDRVLDSLQKTLDPASGGALRLEHRIVRRGGDVRWINSRGRMLYEEETGKPLRLIGTVLDVTNRKKAEAELQEALASKETLLREVNHRIKNNLQLVSSMLGLQGGRSEDAEVRRLVQEAQARLQIVAAVHERLYLSEDLGSVDLDVFLETLCREVEQTGVAAEDAIVVNVRADKVTIGNDRAVPVALVLNELLTNAIKYAYPGRRGTIEVSLARLPDGQAALSVADGGVGLPDNFAERQGVSLGFRIIDGLVRQIHGAIEIEPRSPGVAFQVTFPADRP